MTDQEICREYRGAKNKRAQITILADQQLCTKGEIIKILAENGEDVSTINTKVTGKRSKEDPVPVSVLDTLCNRLDTIEKAIVQLGHDKEAIDRAIKEKEGEYMEIANFLKSCNVEERSQDGKEI